MMTPTSSKDGAQSVSQPDDTDPKNQIDRNVALLIGGAQEATDTETSMGIIEGFKLYPKAVAWSICLSTAVVMEGYVYHAPR
jgi:hypothetical protein